MRRLLGVLLALGLVIGVVLVAQQRHNPRPGPRPSPTAHGSPTALTALSGLIGSEKQHFFADGAVQQALRAQGYAVTVGSSGSFSMAGDVQKGHYDFAIPASSIAASTIPSPFNTNPVRPFYSPMVVVAHTDTADFLAQNGLATQLSGGVWSFDMNQYLADVEAQRKWSDLTGGTRPGDLAGLLYIETTDPASSSSGALYLAIMSYLANNEQLVKSQADIAHVQPLMQYLISNQGALLASSDQLFSDFRAAPAIR